MNAASINSVTGDRVPGKAAARRGTTRARQDPARRGQPAVTDGVVGHHRIRPRLHGDHLPRDRRDRRCARPDPCVGGDRAGHPRILGCGEGRRTRPWAAHRVVRSVPASPGGAVRPVRRRLDHGCATGWKLGDMLRGHTRLAAGRTAVWAWNGVAFVAESGPGRAADSVNAAGRSARRIQERPQPVVWWFGTWRQPDRLVRALESALVDLGHPVAGLSHQVLPLIHISGNPADAPHPAPPPGSRPAALPLSSPWPATRTWRGSVASPPRRGFEELASLYVVQTRNVGGDPRS